MRYIKHIELFEAIVYDYSLAWEHPADIAYTFNADGLPYLLQLSKKINPNADGYKHDRDPHTYDDEWEVSFTIENENLSPVELLTNKAGKDLAHLNNVLNTIATILEKNFIKKKSIKTLSISPSDPVRSAAYLRFFKMRYPEKDVREHKGLIFITC